MAACYGIVTVPTGNWYCRRCESQERSARAVSIKIIVFLKIIKVLMFTNEWFNVSLFSCLVSEVQFGTLVYKIIYKLHNLLLYCYSSLEMIPKGYGCLWWMITFYIRSDLFLLNCHTWDSKKQLNSFHKNVYFCLFLLLLITNKHNNEILLIESLVDENSVKL